MDNLESGIIQADALIGKTGGSIVRNSGKAIAAITIVLAVLLTFTEIRFSDFGSNSFTSNLVMMLIASYLMYFSLEDAGEKLGEESEEYKAALEEYRLVRKKIGSEDIEGLRDFCISYSRDELKYRRRSALTGAGLSEEEYERWLGGERFTSRARRIFRRVRSMKAVRLTPSSLLSQSEYGRACEISNPTRLKIPRMLIKMIPTTIGMSVTVSVMLTMKDGLSAEGVIESILKLATLPIIGFRGYSAGFTHVKGAVIPWMKTKSRLLDTFSVRKKTA